MKNILLATTILAMSAVSAMAFDLGGGLTAGGEVNAEYNVTQSGDIALTATPELVYVVGDMDFTVGTDIDLTNIDFVGLDLNATYYVGSNVELYAEISTNADLDFGDLIVGATLSF